MEIDGPPPELETFREAPECNLGLAAPDQLDLRPDCGPLQMLVVWSHFVAFIGCIDLFLPFPWQRHILAGLMFVQVSYVGSVPHVESRVWSCFYNSCSTITIRHTSAVYSIYILRERERGRGDAFSTQIHFVITLRVGQSAPPVLFFTGGRCTLGPTRVRLSWVWAILLQVNLKDPPFKLSKHTKRHHHVVFIKGTIKKLAHPATQESGGSHASSWPGLDDSNEGPGRR